MTTTTAEQKRTWYAKNREKIAKKRAVIRAAQRNDPEWVAQQKKLREERRWQGNKKHADNWTPQHINFLLSLEEDEDQHHD